MTPLYYYADSVVFSTNAGTAVKNNSRQGLQVRCLDDSNGLKAIYYIGTYSAGGPSGSDEYYSVGYYKVCGAGCTGWYWTYNTKIRTAGWHKLTLDFLPYTGTADVKAYIDGTLVATLDRTPDTQVYGLNMVAYGYHYRVNQDSWFDDVAMYASQPHPAPTAGAGTAVDATSIRWNFTDNSNNEIGFKAVDAANAIKGVTGALTGTGSSDYITETGLAPNTEYTRWIKAYNGSLDSFSSSAVSAWTLSAAPAEGSIACDKAVGTWYNTADFAFTAVGGFGEGTVSGYRYAWSQSPTYAFAGTEPVWDNSDLVVAASADGEWYLHVQGLNAQGAANGTLALGPYRFDGTAPANPTSASETGGAADGEWQSAVSDPAFTWSGAVDALSGIGGYVVYFGTDEDGTSDTEVTEAAYDPAAVDTGTYYLRVCAKDGAGNRSPDWTTLFTFKYDGSAPEGIIVSDDGAYTGSTTKLNAYWYTADPESEIAEYQYAVGTTIGGTDIVGWTSAGTANQATISIPAPGMQEGPTYYIAVKARNEAGVWSTPGTSNGIQVAPVSLTISAAKALANGQPVALRDKVITADLGGAYYIEETDRSSGILVIGAGAVPGTLVTVGGTMGVNEHQERAIISPATVIEAPANPLLIPSALLMVCRDLGGGDLNAWTFGITDGVSANNVGLLVQVAGTVVSVGEGEIWITDGSTISPIKVTAYFSDLTALQPGDVVIVKGVSSLELNGSIRVPAVRVFEASGITKRN